MIITISGPAGSGKTTTAKLLGEKLALHRVSAGGIFREMAKEKNMSLLEFSRYADRHPGADYEIDERMARYAKTMSNIVLEGTLTGWVVHKYGLHTLKVWLDATLSVRAERTARRDGKTYDFALVQIKRRDKSERQRYSRIYSIDLSDLSIYDLVMHTDKLSVKQVLRQIIETAAR